jgi:DNA-binding transcriptional regulator YdaS (Cro superfamily)
MMEVAMGRKISASKAARMLGIHRNTVYAWCKDAVDGNPSKLQGVERNPMTGRYMIEVSEIRRLKGGIL